MSRFRRRVQSFLCGAVLLATPATCFQEVCEVREQITAADLTDAEIIAQWLGRGLDIAEGGG